MRKNVRLLAASLAALSLVATACGGDDSDASDAPADDAAITSEAPTTEGIKAGIAFDTGGRGDGTFNDSAATGGERATSELGAQVTEL
ncbi:MAG: BMP family ABC transporter substrate-binding protein, partial [Actinomycetota bacterium]